MIKELTLIQQEIKAPKTQENKFGGYKYRSLEDITEAIKPLLKQYGVALTFSDKIEPRGTPFVCKDVIDMGYEEKDGTWHPDIREIETVKGIRYFTIATATLTNANGESVSCVAEAEHPETKKGMDPAQVSGSTSSYARKYAANALLCIDDAQDPDTKPPHGPENPGRGNGHTPRQRPPEPPKATSRTTGAGKRGNPPQEAQRTQPTTNAGDGAKSQQENPEKPKETPQGAPEKSPAEILLDFMGKLGVKKENMETVLAKKFEEFVESDFAFLRAVVTHMRKQKINFEDAVELQCKIEADKEDIPK